MPTSDHRPAHARTDLTDHDLSALERRLRAHRRERSRELEALDRGSSVRAEQPGASRTRAALVASTVLEEVDAALDRLADGSYGWCLRCLAPLDRELLHAVPHVAYCAACATAR